MSIESQNMDNGNITYLIGEYVKSLYISKGNPNNTNSINLKNIIIKTLGTIYKDILDGFLAGAIDKQKIFDFINIINNLVGIGIIDAKNNILETLLEKNLSKAKNSQEIDTIKDYIQKEIDKSISNAEKEINEIIEIFKQSCLDILLEGNKGLKNMFVMSHDRTKTKISGLNSEISILSSQNQILTGEIIVLKETNTTLLGENGDLKVTIKKQSETLRNGFNSWKGLNTKVGLLEKERQVIEETIKKIEEELFKKKRKLKGTSLDEKFIGILNFTTEIQRQETAWQQTYIRQQNFDQVEDLLNQDILNLQLDLEKAKTIMTELNSELIDEQRKNQVLTTKDNKIIKDIIGKQITDLLYFLIDSSDFINETKQEELELAIKMTYYKSRSLNFDINNYIDNFLENLSLTYLESYPKNSKKIEKSFNNLISFINELKYGKFYIQNATNKYRDIYVS